MTDPAIKTASVLCLLMVATCAALLFRSDQPSPVPLQLEPEDALQLRIRSDAAVPRPSTPPRAASVEGQASCGSPMSPAVVVTPVNRSEPPPSLSPSYPDAGQAIHSHKAGPMEMMLPVEKPVDENHRTHTVVDGDTLAALAVRYLGDAARAQEIYDANRGELQDPRLLPIGVELKIPPRK